MAIAICIGLQSCDKDLDIGISGSGIFLGVWSYSCVTICSKNREKITYSIEPMNISGGNRSIDICISTTVNDKDVVKSTSYYIDGDMVAYSNDKSNCYSVDYIVKGLNSGGIRCNSSL